MNPFGCRTQLPGRKPFSLVTSAQHPSPSPPRQGMGELLSSRNSPFESRLGLTGHAECGGECFEPEKSLPLYFLFLLGCFSSRDIRQLPFRQFAATGDHDDLLYSGLEERNSVCRDLPDPAIRPWRPSATGQKCLARARRRFIGRLCRDYRVKCQVELRFDRPAQSAPSESLLSN